MLKSIGASASTPPPVIPALDNGVYTPFIGITSGIANASTQAYPANWMRIGNVVTVSGRVDGTTLQSGLLALFTVSLPIVPAAFGDSSRASGVLTLQTASNIMSSGIVYARTAGNAQQAFLQYMPTFVEAVQHFYVLTYTLS